MEPQTGKLLGGAGVGWRHVQVFMLFLGMSLAYAFRINLSVCIVDMTDKNSTSDYVTYDWDEDEKDLVLSAFFWGYVVTQVPAGFLSQRYGPKWFMLLGVGGCAVLSALSPLVAKWGGWRLLCALRVLQGLVQGFVYPSSHTMLSRWVPPQERARWASLVYSGIAVGTVISMAGTGELAASSLGWPAGFYVPGVVGVVWGLAWIILAANSPTSSGAVSSAEREFIEKSFEGTSSGEERLAVPWLKILTSLPMWALIVCHCGHNFGHWVLLTKIPAYMSDVLGFDIESNGLYSALPYLWLTFTSLAISVIAEIVNDNTRFPISRTFSRKMFNSIGHWGMGVFMLILGFVRPSEAMAVFLLTVAVGFEAGTLAGYLVNHMDLSPNFGGALMGITNCLAATIAILAPILAGLITGDSSKMSLEETTQRWNAVFFVAAGVYFSGNLFFVLFGSAEVQPWNGTKTKTKAETLSVGENAEKSKGYA